MVTCLACGQPAQACDGVVCVNCRSGCPLLLPPWNVSAEELAEDRRKAAKMLELMLAQFRKEAGLL